MKRFWRDFLLGFVTLAPILTLLCGFYYNHTHPSGIAGLPGLAQGPGRVSAAEMLLGVPRTWSDLKIATASAAKEHHELWSDYKNSKSDGVGLRTTGNVAFLQEVYPGYRDLAAADPHFWSQYFSRSMDMNVYIPSLNHSVFLPRKVFISLQGCFDIFERYGSDLVIFGNSETAQGLVTKNLYEDLGGAPKILSCVTGTMLNKTVQQAAELLAKMPHKAKIAVWGYSYWSAFSNTGDMPVLEQMQSHLISDYHNAHARSPWLSWKLSDLFGHLDWSDVIKLNYREMRQRDAQNSASAPIVPSVMTQEVVFSTGAVGNEKQLVKLAANVKPFYLALKNLRDSDCNLSEAAEELNQTIAALLKVSEKVFIYLTPTTPLQTTYGPQCFRKAVKMMLQKAAGSRVFVRTLDWTDYGLTWSDYVTPHPEKAGLMQINSNHTNYFGAAKVTAAVGRWIKDSLGKAKGKPL